MHVVHPEKAAEKQRVQLQLNLAATGTKTEVQSVALQKLKVIKPHRKPAEHQSFLYKNVIHLKETFNLKSPFKMNFLSDINVSFMFIYPVCEFREAS